MGDNYKSVEHAKQQKRASGCVAQYKVERDGDGEGGRSGGSSSGYRTKESARRHLGHESTAREKTRHVDALDLKVNATSLQSSSRLGCRAEQLALRGVDGAGRE